MGASSTVSLAFQKVADPLRNGVCELGEFMAGQCFDPAKPG
jgi:hypothetical protein